MTKPEEDIERIRRMCIAYIRVMNSQSTDCKDATQAMNAALEASHLPEQLAKLQEEVKFLNTKSTVECVDQVIEVGKLTEQLATANQRIEELEKVMKMLRTTAYSLIEASTIKEEELRTALKEVMKHQETLTTGNWAAYKLTGAWQIAKAALLKHKGE